MKGKFIIATRETHKTTACAALLSTISNKIDLYNYGLNFRTLVMKVKVRKVTYETYTLTTKYIMNSSRYLGATIYAL